MSQADDPTAAIARASAQMLAPEHGTRVLADVERELLEPGGAGDPDQYLDPISLGALIVSAATLAWQVYTDTRARGAKADGSTLARTVRVELGDRGTAMTPTAERVITVVTEETLRQAQGRQP